MTEKEFMKREVRLLEMQIRQIEALSKEDREESGRLFFADAKLHPERYRGEVLLLLRGDYGDGAKFFSRWLLDILDKELVEKEVFKLLALLGYSCGEGEFLYFFEKLLPHERLRIFEELSMGMKEWKEMENDEWRDEFSE